MTSLREGVAAHVVLPIIWQRLVTTTGETCPRCSSTETEVDDAVATLTEVLGPLGIGPQLQTRVLDQVSFDTAPAESNRIWIAGKPLEEWIGAMAGVSRCSSVCGEHDCRTVESGPSSYETVPAALIVKAGLMAAAALLPG